MRPDQRERDLDAGDAVGSTLKFHVLFYQKNVAAWSVPMPVIVPSFRPLMSASLSAGGAQRWRYLGVGVVAAHSILGEEKMGAA